MKPTAIESESPPAPLSIFVLYDEPARARQIVAATRRLAAREHLALLPQISLWRADLLEEPGCREECDREVAEAHLVVAALSQPASWATAQWLDRVQVGRGLPVLKIGASPD